LDDLSSKILYHHKRAMGLKSLPLPGGQPTANVKTTNAKIPFTVKNKTSRRRISTLTGRSGIGFLQSPSPVPLLMPREPDLFFRRELAAHAGVAGKG
jgi:hypothetical protein